MDIYKATIQDIDDLIKFRIDFLTDEYGPLPSANEEEIREQLKYYFIKHIRLGDFIAFFAKENGEIVSGAFLAIQERPANPFFISGITGTLLNVLTYPEYRRKGIATEVLLALIQDAQNHDVMSIDLFATEDGKQLYEKLGFQLPDYTAMRLKTGNV